MNNSQIAWLRKNWDDIRLPILKKLQELKKDYVFVAVEREYNNDKKEKK